MTLLDSGNGISEFTRAIRALRYIAKFCPPTQLPF